MTRERLVIAGGDAAGMSAGSQAARLRPGLEVIAFEKSPHTSYSACGIPYYVGGVVDDAARLVVRSPEKFREKYGIGARVLHEVEEIDASNRRVRVRDLDGGGVWSEPYDHLLLATGALPFLPDLPGSGTSGIFGTIGTGETFEALARTADGWIGFDPGIAQAGNIGLAHHRWVQLNASLSPACLDDVDLVTLADVQADLAASGS